MDLTFLNYGFMQRAFLAILAISVFAPILGMFLVLRRQSLMSDTLSHVSLAGVAFGLMLGWSPTLSTVLVVLLAAVVMEYLRTIYRHFLEVGTAILMSAGLAISVIVMSKAGGESSLSLDQYLFGSIVTISQEQVWWLAGIAGLVLLLAVFFLRPMYILTFDEDTALVEGLPVRAMSLLFNMVTGVAIALMIPAAGALLVSTIMVLPAAIALRMGKSFRSVMLFGVGIGLLGMLLGLWLSYELETPTSATITLVFMGMFIVVGLFERVSRGIRHA